jgi:hypothetical protein
MKEEIETQQEDVFRQRLAGLRVVLEARRDSAWLAQFDEFIREHEWELALHVVCDHLLESTDHAERPEVLDQIAALHEAMAIEDTCVADLHRHRRE